MDRAPPLPAISRVVPPERSRQLLFSVYLSVGLWAASSGVISVSLPFRFQDLGLPIVDYGIVVGGYALGMLLLETFWGSRAFRLADHRWILLLGSGVLILTLALGSLTTFVPLLLDYTSLGGLIIFLVPLLRFIGMHAQGPLSEGLGVGRTWTFFGGGLALGSVAGPLLFTTWGFEGDVLFAALLFGAAMLIAAAAPWRAAQLPAMQARSTAGLRSVVSLPFVRVSLLVVAAFVVFSFPSNYLPYYGVAFFGVSQVGTGYILGAARLASLLAAFFLGSWGDHHGHPRAAFLGFLLLAAGVAGTWFSPDAIGMVLATIALFVGVGWLGASLLPLAMAPIPARFQGSAIGLYGAVEDLGLLLGPVLYGVAWSSWGAWTTFPVALAAALLGVALTLTLPAFTGRVAGTRPARP